MNADAHLITTERCELRPLTAADADALHAFFLDEPVRRYLLDGELISRAWVDRVIAESEASFAARGLGLWSARAHGEAELLGVTGYREFYEPPVLELLYALASSHWGRGLATEIARAAIEAGFAQGLTRIRASTDAPNTASVRVMERLGMRFESQGPGPRWDQVHYALSREAWQQGLEQGS